ncbi:MAG: hypothetical protein R2864_00500 [Syntrophotaleaceae bacterium]
MTGNEEHTAILLIGHGSARAEVRTAFYALAELVRNLGNGQLVEVAFSVPRRAEYRRRASTAASPGVSGASCCAPIFCLPAVTCAATFPLSWPPTVGVIPGGAAVRTLGKQANWQKWLSSGSSRPWVWLDGSQLDR